MITEYSVFGVLMAANLGVGLYFSRRRKDHSGTAEVFLGSRTLRALPLAVSMVATMLSSTGLVGFTGHYYAYGFHLFWNDLTIILLAPLIAHLFLPVFYKLRITSVFEKLRGASHPPASAENWMDVPRNGGDLNGRPHTIQ
ncbi:hypothetical protein HPB50_004467 [Hyalomma asiaticum]|uniref:Uncharacterized protein n=1 Tax=Hyalomma asiaticum TaxID=266040 RepID=A0ACB7RZ25_HYAAI|nr:hypothetical protein HPB50_004467 [Hyalomma asiaticum]